MRHLKPVVALLLVPVLLAVTSPVLAQQAHIVDPAAMTRAVAEQAQLEDVNRDQIRRVLDRAETREVAERLGLDVAQAQSAVATLDGAELSRLAQHAAGVEASLAGGANTIVISTTTLLLVLIIVILLVK